MQLAKPSGWNDAEVRALTGVIDVVVIELTLHFRQDEYFAAAVEIDHAGAPTRGPRTTPPRTA